MPYKIVKVDGGYKVGIVGGGKMSNGRYHLSNKPMNRSQAIRQKKAVEISEAEKAQEEKKKIRTNIIRGKYRK